MNAIPKHNGTEIRNNPFWESFSSGTDEGNASKIATSKGNNQRSSLYPRPASSNRSVINREELPGLNQGRLVEAKVPIALHEDAEAQNLLAEAEPLEYRLAQADKK